MAEYGKKFRTITVCRKDDFERGGRQLRKSRTGEDRLPIRKEV
ncbi:hypothetical protein AALA98_05620 [Lachnospiraceae bacterium 45-W7]